MSVLMALGNTHNKHVTHNKPVNFNAQAQTKINNISKKKNVSYCNQGYSKHIFLITFKK